MKNDEEERVRISDGLYRIIHDWAVDNCAFPVDFLNGLTSALLEKNFRAAANSLKPIMHGLVPMYDSKQNSLVIYIEWDIESAGPPKARTLIYDYTKKYRKGLYAFFQQIHPPLPKLMLVRDVGLGLRLGSALLSNNLTKFYYCLPEELQEEVITMHGCLSKQAAELICSAIAPFLKAETVEANEPNLI